MMEEEGVVSGIEGNYAFVVAKPSSACDGCSQKGVCHVLGGSGDMMVKALNEIRADIGDRVVVGITSRTFFKASALLYLFPVAALLIGGTIGNIIADSIETSLSSELISAIIGMSSLFISFFFVRAYGKKMGESKMDQARIIKVL